MRPSFSVFLAFFLALAAVAPAEENVWTSHGPTDIGWITDLAVAGSAVYAATYNGVFRSDDGGETWRQSGLAGQWIYQIIARPGASVVFAINPLGTLYATQDGGQTWSSVPGLTVASAAIDPGEPSTVYAALGDGTLMKSTDAGVTWQFLWSSGEGWPRVFAFDSRAVFLLTYSRLHKSVDGGASWTSAQPPMGTPSAIAAGAAPGVVYAATNRVCRSADSAATWTCSRVFGFNFYRIVEVPGDTPATPRLLAVSEEGVILSRDGGGTWAPVAGDLGNAGNSLVLASDPSGSLVLAGSDRRIYRSRDHGDVWTAAGAGLRASWILAIAVDPQNSSRVWAGAGGWNSQGPGLFGSSDAGLSWSPVVDKDAPSTVAAIAIDPDDAATMYAASADGWGLFRTRDGGLTWASNRLVGGAVAIALDPRSPEKVWAASSSGLYRSDDGARTWNHPAVTQGVYAVLFDGRRPDTIYAGSDFEVDDSGGWGPYPEGGSIFVSRDRGASFIKGSYDFGNAVSSIVTDPFQDGGLYAATRGTGVFHSADGGVTWESASAQLPDLTVLSLVADPARPGRLYAATQNGVFRTIDGGRSWHAFSSGLASLSTGSLAISPDGKWLHAGTHGGGVFELDLQTDVPAFPCVPGETRLCLVGNRYAVDLLAARRGETRYTPGSARTLGDRAGYFGISSATGDPDLPEVVVKMLGEGAFGEGSGAPIFYSSLTKLPYAMTVTDTVTGRQQIYAGDPAAPLCGATDVPFEALEDSISLHPARAAAVQTAIPLLGGRFSVTLSARHAATNRTADGVAMTSGDRFGFFSLPEFMKDPHYPEVVVKMLDGRAINGNFWFFHTGLTGLDYTLTVTDSVTGAVRTYESPQPFCGHADVRAFSD